MNKADLTTSVFENHNCAQTIFSIFAPELGIDRETALRISAGFGSGMNNGDTCGAVTGSYMVIGLKSGHSSANPEDKERTRELIRKFNALFIKEHGSLKCRELLGYDISDPGQKLLANESGVFGRCPYFLKTAAKILEKHF
jgi:C_GCAxxG_C_C family probable redox protein